MRVEPELPDHPQYRRLKRRVGDYAMEALLRIWGHCQQNKRGEFWPGADAEYLELIAEWEGEPGLLYRSLTDKDIGFVVVEEGGLRIHNWDEMNPQFVKNWVNGPKGGRPKKDAGSEEINQSKTSRLTSHETVPELGFPAISGDQSKNQSVNPIPVPVSESQSSQEPTTPNLTKLNQTEPNLTKQGGSGLRYDLATAVIAFLNQQTGADFKGTRSEVDAIAACLLSVGNDLEGVKKMVARQAVLWLPEAKSAQWLQPRTLFDEEKFPGYFAMRNLPTDIVTTDPRQRRRELEELIEKHPANRQSTFHDANATEAVRENLKKLRLELSQLFQKNAPQKVGAGSGV